MSIQAIASLLRSRVGLELQSLGEASLQHAIAERMRRTGDASVENYFANLLGQEQEFAALCAEISVPESWFFRDPLQIAGFLEFARNFRANRPGQPLRVLSLPCAAGEEAYTLAIALLEDGWQAHEFSVYGIDLNESYLQRARLGEYGAWALRSRVPPTRFAEMLGDGIRVTAWVKAQVQFKVGNVVDPLLFGEHECFQVIFSRNLLIYLTEAAKRTWLSTLQRVLSADGLVVTGHAESLSTLDPDYFPRSNLGPNCFGYGQAPVKPAAWSTPPQPFTSVVRAVPTQVTASVAAPTPALNTLAPDSEAALQKIRELADSGQLDRAALLIKEQSLNRGEDADLLYLSGVVASARGQMAHAKDQFERALYLRREHAEALSMLALLAERSGQLDQARRYRDRLKRMQLRSNAHAAS